MPAMSSVSSTPIELTKVAYTMSATCRGGRQGHVHSADGAIDLDLGQPDLGQPDSGGKPAVNPETLLAAGWAACFQASLITCARAHGIDASACEVTADISLGPARRGGFGIAAELKISLPGVAPETVRDMVERAHAYCPYSRATRDNMPVTLTIV